MPGPAAVKKAPAKAPEKVAPKLKPKEARALFAKEVHYQCYRIENVLKIKDKQVVAQIAKTRPGIIAQPYLLRFFDAYGKKQVPSFIEKAKGKTAEEREKLLDGIRRVIYKAKFEKLKAAKLKQKVKKEEDAETRKLNEMLRRKLNVEELASIEASIASPFDIGKGKLNLNKVQTYYKRIILAQKAMATHTMAFQGKFGAAVKRLKKFQKKYEFGWTNWRSHLGVVDWGYRKVSGIVSWAVGGIKSIFGSKPKKKPSEKDKVNKLIAQARSYYKDNLERVKSLKRNIAARADQIKKGLGIYKEDVREKLKFLIGRQDWTKAKLLQREAYKKELEKKKKDLQEGFKRAQQTGKGIDRAKAGTQALDSRLRLKYSKIQTGEIHLNIRIKLVKGRIAKLEKLYGKDDHRVKEMRQKVLIPLLKGSDRMKGIKEGTARRLTAVDKKNQRLEILRADVYLGETQAAETIEALELKIKQEGGKIDVLSKQRLKLHELLEGMEMAYVAVDEFKVSIDKSLGKITKDNNKLTGVLDKQFEFLKKAKAEAPGLGSAIYNTIGIGRIGFFGALKTIGRIPGFVVWGINRLGGGNYGWKEIDEYSVTGLIGKVQKKFDAWLKKDGFRQYSKNGWAQFFGAMGNFAAGGVNTVLSVANGLSMLIFDTTAVIESLGVLVTDWEKFKEALAHVIHLKDWKEGRADIAAGKTIGDLVILFLTAGSSAGAQAAAKGASTAGKMARYIGGFAKGVARETIHLPWNIAKFAYSLPGRVIGGIKGIGAFLASMKGGIKGMRLYRFLEKPAEKLVQASDDITRHLDKIPDRHLNKLSSRTRELVEKVRSQGISNASAQTLAELTKRLSVEFYASGWRVRNIIDPLAKGVRKYMNAKARVEAGKIFLKSKGIEVGGKAVEGISLAKTSGALPARSAQAAVDAAKAEVTAAEAVLANAKKIKVKRRLIRRGKKTREQAAKDAVVREATEVLNAAKGKLKSSQAALKAAKAAAKKTAPSKAVLKEGAETFAKAPPPPMTPRSLRGIDKLINRLKEGRRTSIFERFKIKRQIREAIRQLEIEAKMGTKVGTRATVLRQYLDEIRIFERSSKTAQATKETSKVSIVDRARTMLSEYKEKLATTPRKQLAINGLVLFKNILLWPVWLSTKYVRNFVRLSPAQVEAISRGTGLAEKVAHYQGVMEISGKINGLLRVGKLKDAIQLYHAARIMANKAGVSFTLLDKSFLGYLHRVAPASAMYLNRASELTMPDVLRKIPKRVPPNLKAMNENRQKLKKSFKILTTSQQRLKKPKPKKK